MNKKIDGLCLITNEEISLKEYLEESFENVEVITDKSILDRINDSVNMLYLLGENELYSYILPRLKKEVEVCFIFNESFSSMSELSIRYNLQHIFENIERKLVSTIGCFDIDNYRVLTNAGYNCQFININLPQDNYISKITNDIGILSDDFDPKHNFYNQLASLTFIDYGVCKLKSTMHATNYFIKDFNIRIKKLDDIFEIMKDNFVNLYINFTGTNKNIIKKSFNMGVPCIIGNCDIFDNNSYLKEHLVLKSDDDINEIVEKINFARDNKEKILREYKTIQEKSL